MFRPVHRGLHFCQREHYPMSLSRHLIALLSRMSWSAAQRRAFNAGLLGTLLAVIAPTQAQEAANDRWVSDALTTYVRSGPTDGYRIVGSLTSGQKVELLETSGDYSQVRGENGDRVWIRSSDLQEVPGQAERLPQLEQQVAELSEELKTIDDS